MRVKKRCMVLTFYTTTDAMAMEKRCAEWEIPGRLIPVPRDISAGCGLAWKILYEDYEIYGTGIDNLKIPFQEKVELWV